MCNYAAVLDETTLRTAPRLSVRLSVRPVTVDDSRLQADPRPKSDSRRPLGAVSRLSNELRELLQ